MSSPGFEGGYRTARAALARILGHHVAIDAKHLLLLLLPVTDQAFVRDRRGLRVGQSFQSVS